jgi:hypothetical protein
VATRLPFSTVQNFCPSSFDESGMKRRLVAPHGHLDAGDQQDGAEDVDDPVPLLEHVAAGRDEAAAHDQRADDPPEEDAVLVLGGNREVREDDGDDEDVVDRQRLLHQVAGEELEAHLRAGVLRWKTPRSSASMTRTKALNPTQNQMLSNMRASSGGYR